MNTSLSNNCCQKQGCQRLIKEEIPKRRVYDFEPDSDMVKNACHK